MIETKDIIMIKENNMQLELDFQILTLEQRNRVNNFIKNSKDNAIKNAQSQDRIEALLIQGGFIEGVHYVNDFETKTVTENRSFGYGESQFHNEVTYVQNTGGCKIKYQIYDSSKNEIITRFASVFNNSDKLECSSITDQYRSYKPTSLFTKLLQYNEKAEYNFNSANKEKMILEYTVNKYKSFYSDAEVSIGSDYNRNKNNYTSFPIVIVSFKSGSYISLRLGSEINKEYLHKKFNAVASQMTTAETLNMFNLQKAK